jgi:hypothetical protein
VCIRHHRMNSSPSAAPVAFVPSRWIRFGVIRTSIPYKCRTVGPSRWPCMGIDHRVGCTGRCCGECPCPSDGNRSADTWGSRRIRAGCNGRTAFQRIQDDMNKRQLIGRTDWNAILGHGSCKSIFLTFNKIFIILVK